MKANRVLLMANLAAFLLLVLAACGGGMSGISTPPPPGGGGFTFHSFGFSSIPNHLTLHFQKQESAQSFSLLPVVHAQGSGGAVMTGDYNGSCEGISAILTDESAVVLYGAGSLNIASCNQFYFGAGVDPGNAAALNAQSGALVIGSGTLQGLVAVDDKTSIPTGASSGKIEVWVLRNGTVLQTPITVTLGLNREVEDTTDTFAVQDQDQIIVTATVEPTDALNGIQWYLGKQ